MNKLMHSREETIFPLKAPVDPNYGQLLKTE